MKRREIVCPPNATAQLQASHIRVAAERSPFNRSFGSFSAR
jgi:hypothetical protein